MTGDASNADDRSRQIDAAIAEYLEALDQGAPPEMQAFIARHAAIAGELRDFLADYSAFKRESPRPGSGNDATSKQSNDSANPMAVVSHEPAQTSDLIPAIAPGTTVGTRYRLLEVIGEGGMGTVWMAEQREPMRRMVALKLVKPGMASKAVLTRFGAERQALALMDHPNIAKVLDGGATEDGRPYFVMELVKGIPLTQYCDERRLPVDARLDLFVQVCQAVQHAHQKGIIHRDIKPTNILVSEHDGRPVPKVIDFGLAKALQGPQALTEHTLFTAFGAMVGTPLYMAPEQVGINALDIDTRSDVYALGVILYELLTGSTPLEKQRFKQAAWEEICRLIREEEPPRPSMRLSSSDALPSIAACRHTEPEKLGKLVRGDLDWIVLKALEKDRNRRYETANGLAVDIQRHLADEPIAARPPTSLYRFQKLVRRNKLAFTAIGCVMLALVIGLAASLWQAGRAEREAARAKQEADRASAALNDLQAAAPSIAAEAAALVAKDKFDEAIDKLDYAARLRPDAPEYVLAKADLLETQLRLDDAAEAYRDALKLKPDDARAKENAELCDQLIAAPKSPDGKLSRESHAKLSAQMTKEQRPAAEIMPVARLLGDENKYIVNYWLERMKDLPNGTDTPLEKRLTVRDDGLLDLNLGETNIADLSPLAGMPLGTLSIRNCTKVTDLSPLRGMPLTTLSIAFTGVSSLEPLRGMNSLEKLFVVHTKVTDLSPLQGLRLKWLDVGGCNVGTIAPLRGMPLEQLVLGGTVVSDLSPLVGMPLKDLILAAIPAQDFSPLAGLPLETCFLGNTRVGDLAFLNGAPLKQLVIWQCPQVRGLKVLSDLKSLEVLWLPINFVELPLEEIVAIESLRNHPSLKQIGAEDIPNMPVEKAPSQDAFWAAWDRDHAWALRLRKAGFTFNRWRLDDGTWGLSIARNQSFTDLSILAGVGIGMLDLVGSGVSDLTPLKGMPLKQLNIASSPVEDLAPLRGMKLERLSIAGTKVIDLTPIKGMPITSMDVSGTEVSDLTPLVGMPLHTFSMSDCELITDLSPLAGMADTLESLILPKHPADIKFLRAFPKLQRLSSRFDTTVKGPAQTAAEFWAEYDRTKSAAAP